MNTQAQSGFTDIVVFGDSLMDNGNWGTVFTNDDSDGSGDKATIAPEYLADHLGFELNPALFGGNNYGVGGHQTPDVFNAIAGTGIATHLGTRGSYLSEVGNAIPGGTLFLVDGGGNDINAILQGNAATPELVPGLIEERINTYTASVGALHAAGAQYIMVSNVPDVGNVPGIKAAELLGLIPPGFSSLFTDASNSFNDGFSLFQYMGVRDANIIPVDLNGMISFILDNADEYGFASGDLDLGFASMDQRFMCYDGSNGDCVEHPLFGLNSVATPGDTSDPRKLIFNDALHPAEKTSEITGDYLIDIISAPMKVGALPNMALNAGRTQAAVGADELRSSRWGAGEGRLFISGDTANSDDPMSSAPEADSKSLTIGHTLVVTENLVLGAAITASEQNMAISGADFEAESLGLSGLMGYHKGNLFVDAAVSFATLSYDDLVRDVKLGSKTLSANGSTEGRVWTTDLLAGYDLLSAEDKHFAPAIGLQFSSATVDGYTESGGEISNYAWSDQERESFQLRIGAVASAQLSKNIQVFAEVFSVTEEDDENQDIRIRNTNLSGQMPYTLPSYIGNDESFISATVGASMTIVNGASMNLNYHYSDRGDGQDQVVFSYAIPM
jgi:outer membrane lipase/esterase